MICAFLIEKGKLQGCSFLPKPKDSGPFWTSKQYCVYSRNQEPMSKREAFCFSNSGQIAMVFFEKKKI